MTPEEKILKAQERQAMINASQAVEQAAHEMLRAHKDSKMKDAQAIIKKYRDKKIKKEIFIERMAKSRKERGLDKTKEKQVSGPKNHPTKGKRDGKGAKFQRVDSPEIQKDETVSND